MLSLEQFVAKHIFCCTSTSITLKSDTLLDIGELSVNVVADDFWQRYHTDLLPYDPCYTPFCLYEAYSCAWIEAEQSLYFLPRITKEPPYRPLIVMQTDCRRLDALVRDYTAKIQALLEKK
ncbi:MAG: hypothetical protein ACMXYC_00240 [Candidatus Woesearchaeota archaeon]